MLGGGDAAMLLGTEHTVRDGGHTEEPSAMAEPAVMALGQQHSRGDGGMVSSVPSCGCFIPALCMRVPWVLTVLSAGALRAKCGIQSHVFIAG